MCFPDTIFFLFHKNKKGLFSGACPPAPAGASIRRRSHGKKEVSFPCFSSPPKNRQAVGRPSPFLPPPNPRPLCFTCCGSCKKLGEGDTQIWATNLCRFSRSFCRAKNLRLRLHFFPPSLSGSLSGQAHLIKNLPSLVFSLASARERALFSA